MMCVCWTAGLEWCFQWEELSLYLPRDHHSRSRSRSQTQALAKVSTIIWLSPAELFPGRAILSFHSPQHPFEVSAAFRASEADGPESGARERDSFPFLHHHGSTLRVSAHQSNRMPTAWLINIHPVSPHLHEHTACLIKITEASAPPPPLLR